MNLSLSMVERHIGDLLCRVVDTSMSAANPEKVVLLCHGYGAGGDDLVPCAYELHRAAEISRTRFVFPAAPIELDDFYGDARAWWPIDVMALQDAIATGRIRDLRNDEPELLKVRRGEIVEVIEQLRNETGLDTSKLILGGFSQGAMLTTDVALNIQGGIGGLLIWSGTLLNETNWTRLAAQMSADEKFPIFQSHGRLDPILPFSNAERLRDMLLANGFPVTFQEFLGPHTIPPEAIASAAQVIENC
ncbi:MAG TPA: lysophospholipase [Pirellulaceae bacterium]|nr:lysophospholipase [Pirellulaceae bacterium]HMP67873.1 lysophospholipase [Pirellulaceae bacterium]